MTARERVMAACNFQKTDRIPIDIGGTQVSGIHVDEYCELLKALGISETPTVYEQLEMLARVNDSVRKRLHSDVIPLENPSMSFGLKNSNWKLWKTTKGNVCYMPGDFNPTQDEEGGWWLYRKDGSPIAHMPKNGLYFDFADKTTLSSDISWMDPKAFRETIAIYNDDELRMLEKKAKELYETTEYAVVAEFAQCKYGSMTRTFAGLSPTDWLCMLITEPEYIESILDVAMEQALLNAELFLQAVGSNVDIFTISAIDFGSQRMEVFNPEIWKNIYMPRYRKVNDFIHDNAPGKKTFIHTCGCVRHMLPHIIEAGFDILNPVQLTAENMDAQELVDEFGGKIVFWGGGIDTQTVLPFGTPEEVAAQVKERLEIFSQKGGYIFNPVHCIQYGVPIDNLLAAADIAYNFKL